jgi:hypothetical protein
MTIYSYMIPNYKNLVKGSSLTFSALRGRGKEKHNAAKIFRRQCEGAAEGGGRGGNSAAPEPERSPAALPERLSAEPSRKIAFTFSKLCARRPFLLKKVIFLRGSAAWRHGGGAERLDFFRNF